VETACAVFPPAGAFEAGAGNKSGRFSLGGLPSTEGFLGKDFWVKTASAARDSMVFTPFGQRENSGVARESGVNCKDVFNGIRPENVY
jgi:hypothetical protein